LGGGKLEKEKRFNTEDTEEEHRGRREEMPFGRMAFPGVASVIARVCCVW